MLFAYLVIYYAPLTHSVVYLSHCSCKSMFTYTDGLPILLGMVINFPQVRFTYG